MLQRAGIDRRPGPAFCALCGLRLRARCYRFGHGDWPIFVCWKCVCDARDLPPPPKPLDDR